MDKNGLSSFLLGLGVGIGLGILFAPKSGRETRQLIKNKAEEGTDFLKQRGCELSENASGWVEKGKEVLNRQKDHFDEAVAAGRKAYEETVGPDEPTGETL
jgi:gas vesicle protein